eukprot:jgi/Undpi1/3506/HiC_scaffold_16.g06878.m1
MNNARAIKAVVTIASCSAAAAFVPPATLGKTCAASPRTSSPQPDGSSNTGQQQQQQQRQLPKSRVEASAVRPLNIGGFSLSSIGDLFNRKCPSKDTGTCLPQDPMADQAARKKQLSKKQGDYKWSTSGIPVGTPFLEGFPPGEEFPKVTWITQLVTTLLSIAVGTFRGTFGATEIAEALTSINRAQAFLGRISSSIRSTPRTRDRAVDIEDYEELHAFPVRNPDSMYDWEDDDTFARLRLQGANCVVLEKCTEATRAKLKVLDTDPAYKALKKKVDSLMKAGKLFVVDHELLAGMEAAPVDGLPRYLTPSVALFEVVEDDLLPIRPIGIQLSQGETATPIFEPSDGTNWAIAKACFESADFIIHEVVSHLGNTHIVLEGPIVAMNRQLPKEHPIYDLLQPHLEGTAFINYFAQQLLIVEGGAVDRLQANDIKDSLDLVLAQTLERIKKDFSPEADFEARQVTKKDFPGRYMYRDVGTQYWEATHTWVKEYLDLYYQNDQDMVDDYELQAFMEEMTDIAQMKWFKEFDTTNDKKALIAKILASIIYSASTLHAAVNFPQKPSMSFVPSCPGSMFAPPPTDKSPRSFEDYMSYLVPMEIATTHVSILTLLGSVYHTKLGQYSTNQFDDDRVRVPLAKFQQTIEDIETDLIDTNAYLVSEWRKRGKEKKSATNFAYTTLLPDNIPQSTNI